MQLVAEPKQVAQFELQGRQLLEEMKYPVEGPHDVQVLPPVVLR